MSKYIPRAIGEIVIDATDCSLGRIASYAAKYALEGYKVYIVNSEKAIITGNKEWIKEFWHHKVHERGDWYKGPFYPRMPDRILRRVIRGMLPYHTHRGRVAYRRVKCYIGFPDELKNKKVIRIDKAKPKFERGNIKYMYLKDLSEFLGAKIRKV